MHDSESWAPQARPAARGRAAGPHADRGGAWAGARATRVVAPRRAALDQSAARCAGPHRLLFCRPPCTQSPPAVSAVCGRRKDGTARSRRMGAKPRTASAPARCEVDVGGEEREP